MYDYVSSFSCRHAIRFKIFVPLRELVVGFINCFKKNGKTKQPFPFFLTNCRNFKQKVQVQKVQPSYKGNSYFH